MTVGLHGCTHVSFASEMLGHKFLLEHGRPYAHGLNDSDGKVCFQGTVFLKSVLLKGIEEKSRNPAHECQMYLWTWVPFADAIDQSSLHMGSIRTPNFLVNLGLGPSFFFFILSSCLQWLGSHWVALRHVILVFEFQVDFQEGTLWVHSLAHKATKPREYQAFPFFLPY